MDELPRYQVNLTEAGLEELKAIVAAVGNIGVTPELSRIVAEEDWITLDD